LQAELQALRGQVAQLQAERATQQAAADRYQQRQVRFRTIFEHSPLGQALLAPDLTIRQANTAVIALLGLDASEPVVGRRILEFVPPAYQADWARLQEALWQHQAPWFALETCLLRPDGTQRWCRVTSVLFVEEEEEWGYTTLEDLTPQQELEARAHEHLRALQNASEELSAYNEELQVGNEELQEANAHLVRLNAELDTFVYAASHDLRAPVATLQELLQALEEQLVGEARQGEPVEPLLAMMQAALRRFYQALDRLADFGAVLQQTSLPQEPVVLARVIENVRQELEPALLATQGQLEVDLAGNPVLWFAAQHVHSVLVNLIRNALQYRHPERPPYVRVRCHREPGGLLVSVQDNGLGISAEQQKQLFRLFRRLHPHVEGTGVGLYLVKKILENAGGSIRVQSQLGRGSTFTAVFPTGA